MADLKDRRFKVEVSYEGTELIYQHRYHIKCYDLNGGVMIYHSSSVVDNNVFVSDEEAKERIRNFFLLNYDVNLPL